MKLKTMTDSQARKAADALIRTPPVGWRAEVKRIYNRHGWQGVDKVGDYLSATAERSAYLARFTAHAAVRTGNGSDFDEATNYAGDEAGKTVLALRKALKFSYPKTGFLVNFRP